MLRKLTSLAVCLLFFVVAAQAAKRAFSIEDLYRIRSVGDAQPSPDGKSIVFVLATRDLPRAKSASHIWMMDADGSSQRQLTWSEKSEHSPRFSPDGRMLAFLSDQPHRRLLECGGSRVLMVHSTPWEPRGEYVHPGSPALARFAEAADDADFVLYGHTHQQIVHRVGRVELGEASVVIAVSAPHRQAALDACKEAIDTLKETVPLWKKEVYEGGEEWIGRGS